MAEVKVDPDGPRQQQLPLDEPALVRNLLGSYLNIKQHTIELQSVSTYPTYVDNVNHILGFEPSVAVEKTPAGELSINIEKLPTLNPLPKDALVALTVRSAQTPEGLSSAQDALYIFPYTLDDKQKMDIMIPDTKAPFVSFRLPERPLDSHVLQKPGMAEVIERSQRELKIMVDNKPMLWPALKPTAKAS